jgi:uncharacterized protein (TIGR03643 family)
MNSAPLKRKDRLALISAEDVPRIVKMALEDRTPFEMIEAQFGLMPDDVVIFMRKNLKRSSFLRWRQRAHTQGHLKNPKKSHLESERFKSPNQRQDGSIKQRYRY